MPLQVRYDGPQPGSTLVVSLAEDSDAGRYICAMGQQDEQQAIKHTVQIRGEFKKQNIKSIFPPFFLKKIW